MLSFVASAVAVSVTFVAALVPPISGPVVGGGTGGGGAAQFPAPAGYLLPWAGGEIHGVTQGEETTFTHNGTAAYAFDFDLNYDTVVASRGGRVQFAYDGSNSGGCSAIYSSSSNYVVIDHGDGTSGLYLHLAYGSTQVEVGQIVEQGQPLAISGETGVTCSGGGDGGPGPHLHFQVQRFDPSRYFTQSLPIAFDDISGNSGVPTDGASYVSGNFGKGQPQKIKLTPRRVPRVFNPQAVPSDPGLLEVVEPLPPPPVEGAPVEGTQVGPPAALPAETETPTPTATATHTPAPDRNSDKDEDKEATPATEPTAVPEDTPAPPPPPEDTPVPSSPEAGLTNAAASLTATPTPTPTPSPSPSATPSASLAP